MFYLDIYCLFIQSQASFYRLWITRNIHCFLFVQAILKDHFRFRTIPLCLLNTDPFARAFIRVILRCSPLPFSLTLGFDSTCDLSAVLGILSSASVFTADVQNFSSQVRGQVRNEWGHCNFESWDETKFADSFKLMHSFLKAVKLSPDEEKTVADQLTDWENKGRFLGINLLKLEQIYIHFSLGHPF